MRHSNVCAINRGPHSQYTPDPAAEVSYCAHRIALHPARPQTLFMQKHWDVMRSGDTGDSWCEVSDNVYVSADSDDHWQAIMRDLPAVLSVSVQTLA